MLSHNAASCAVAVSRLVAGIALDELLYWGGDQLGIDAAYITGGRTIIGLLGGRGIGRKGFHGATKPRGQIHHPVSTKVHRQLQKNPGTKGHYKPRDPRITTQAVDEAAHRGYQKWHRDLDDEVVTWLQENPDATPRQFEDWLRRRYREDDLRWRFPLGF